MKYCCKTMALALREEVLVIGYDLNTLSDPDVEHIMLKSDKYHFYCGFCPFCGRKVEVEFEEEEKNDN